MKIMQKYAFKNYFYIKIGFFINIIHTTNSSLNKKLKIIYCYK